MNTQMGPVEEQFAELLWEWAPVSSGQLVEKCQEWFGWKKSTMYTMLKRLCQRGLFQNQDGAVSALVSRADYLAQRSETLVEESFGGSLPLFVAAFTRRRKLSAQDISQLQALIDQSREEA